MEVDTIQVDDVLKNGIFEYIPEDGSTVDLTQPGLLSRKQLVSILRRRGFGSLVSKCKIKRIRDRATNEYFYSILTI